MPLTPNPKPCSFKDLFEHRLNEQTLKMNVKWMNERNPQFVVTLELYIVAGGFWFSESCFWDFPREEGTEEGRKKRRRGILRCSKQSTRESQNCLGTTTATNSDGVVVLKSFGDGVSGRSHLHCSSFCCNSSSTPCPGTRATASRELLVSSFSFLFLYATLCFSGSVSLFLQCE